MAWIIYGTDARIAIEDNAPYVSGWGQQKAYLIHDTSENVLTKVKNLEAVWTISPANGNPLHIDPIGGGLLKRVQAKPDATHFMITDYSGSPIPDQRPAVGFSICLPPKLFDSVFLLWKDFVLVGSNAEYSISLDYIGFKVAHAQLDDITEEEWMAHRLQGKKSALGSGVEIGFNKHAKTEPTKPS